MKIAVLAGGLSPERDVSLSSGALIANALAARGHEVALADIYFDAVGVAFSSDADHCYTIPDIAPDLEQISAQRRKLREENGVSGRDDALIGNGIIELCQKADIAYLALHGGCGENGQLQATLDCFGIKYTGSGHAGSLLGMDKELTKLIFESSGVLSARYIAFDAEEFEDDDIEDIIAELGLPCVVKPCCCGSSVGVSIVGDRRELVRAIADASVFKCRIIVEEMIRGREFSIGILEGKALPPIEIIPKNGFYDYKNKYQSGLTEEICPAPITDEETERMAQAALKAHEALRLGTYSRIDFILSEENGEFYCLEANSLPGMTPSSLMPQEAAAVGIGYGELCEKIALSPLADKE